jgi:hypothetical protein
VQNLLLFRFANTFLEPIRNNHYGESVQITMVERSGVAGRDRSYEEVGAIRVVQWARSDRGSPESMGEDRSPESCRQEPGRRPRHSSMPPRAVPRCYKGVRVQTSR